ncbi:fructokinase-like 2, chloroplastic [Magnolia sinica]|uniref:fructokinase-like 2, chloroplastic n=1 Tax=Magnolia sinica TaxID=86752 RepID=UPI00265A60B6|nr:fructokinase-like 2, chloroplastic [Magnolia sinica]
MASLSFIHPLQIPRRQSNCSIFVSSDLMQFRDLRLPKKWGIRAVSKKSAAQSGVEDSSNDNGAAVEKAPKSAKRATKRSKKVVSGTPVENDVPEVVNGVTQEESGIVVASGEDSKKVPRRSQKKATSSLDVDGEGTPKKVTRRRRTRKMVDGFGDQSGSEELSGHEEPNIIKNIEDEKKDLQFEQGGEDDISFTYGWPPLVCCFGAAQHSFIPSGRPANRLINHDIHETKKDMLWSPPKFVRAPGGSSSSVALALASLGGRVTLMGKLGDDEYGQALLYHLNVNNVQTRSVKVDGSRFTALSYMKITRRGGFKLTCVKPSAEDCLLSSEINIDVLKEAKMFYFNSSSLLDENMRSTTMQAIEISKKFGGVIFFDLNLPFPLWHSNEETKAFIDHAWNSADIIEVTKQELEFLCGIKPSETFDTKDNDRSKFVHYKPDVIKPLWHENLKVLFVTNGTSKLHYYTDKVNGAVLGMEDAPITPFTCDMSASGDAIVAAIMRMLTVQPHLATDEGYLKHMIKYAISCGVTDQWLVGRTLGFPPKGETEGMATEANGVRSITEKEFRTLSAVS